MLEDMYRTLSYKLPTTDGWAVSLGTSVTSQGFIQPIGGNETFNHLNLATQVTSRLYCAVSLPLVSGATVTQDGYTYNVLYAEQPAGISGVGHHKEILLGKFEG